MLSCLPPGLKGMALEVIIPSTIVDTPVLQINVHASSTSAAASTDVIIATITGIEADSTKTRNVIVPFTTHLRSVHFDFLVTGSTSATFSTVTAYLILNVGQEWVRTVEFHS